MTELCPHCGHEVHSINACVDCNCDPYRGRLGPHYRPDHNGECHNCDEPLEGHDANERCRVVIEVPWT